MIFGGSLCHLHLKILTTYSLGGKAGARVRAKVGARAGARVGARVGVVADNVLKRTNLSLPFYHVHQCSCRKKIEETLEIAQVIEIFVGEKNPQILFKTR